MASSRARSFFFTHSDKERDFIERFWQNPGKANELLHKLDAFSENSDRNEYIRRECYSLFIYGIVLNLENNGNNKFFSTITRHRGDIWLMKVGYTRVHTEEEGTTNRPEQVQNDIEDSVHFETELKFNLRLNFVDMCKDKEAEKNIRSRLGFDMDPKVAKKLNLPFHTEWIFTSKRVIEDIEKKIGDFIEKYHSQGEITRVLTTEVFTSPYQEIDPMLHENATALQDLLESIPK